MAEFFTQLNEKQIQFVKQQKIFFTASAACEGHVNLSPKGMDTFAVIDNNTVAYLDLTGSGNETAAHLHQNPRLTIMMCSFAKQPLIFRLYGKGEVINQYHPDWATWLAHFPPQTGTRQIIVLHIEKVQTSCGYAVPTAENFKQRDTLKKWAEKKGEKGIQEYWEANNLESMDGHPSYLLQSKASLDDS
ncbi:MAG TPA: pyridoxamine 5'-phosphate oxidase family protein [Gammaproteobacteria bacterium]|nr:pyridoxamine 5'-phosphate oxidase family protein [Gammaproteobacteria bacterium]